MTTLRQVNRALKQAGHPELLARGNGYFYFYGGESARWYSSSIATYSLKTWSVEDVLRERAFLADPAVAK